VTSGGRRQHRSGRVSRDARRIQLQRLARDLKRDQRDGGEDDMQCSDPSPHGGHMWKDENADVHACPGR
jgi:hypothetical protein